MKNQKNTLDHKQVERRARRAYSMVVCVAAMAACLTIPAFAADDPLAVIENLSEFIFSLIRAIGLILLGWGIVPGGPVLPVPRPPLSVPTDSSPWQAAL